MPVEVFVGLGSNIDPANHLHTAVEALRRCYGFVDISPVYRNSPVGFTGDDFLNLVVRFQCDEQPAELERTLSAMERAAGREPSAAGREPGPRTLDLDLLLYGSAVAPELGLPHSDILRYAFVLRPLAELAPDFVHPLTGRSLTSHWRDLAGQSPPMQAAHIGELRGPAGPNSPDAAATSQCSDPHPPPESVR